MGQKGKIGSAAVVARELARRNVPEPEAPADLSEAAQKEWTRITDLLRDRGALDAIDQAALHDYLQCWARVAECEASINEHGVLVKGERGLVKNPAIQIGRTYRDAMVTWSRELGLTFAARTRLSIEPKPAAAQNRFTEIAREARDK